MSEKETYLGDGLYASFDGFQVKLRAPREHGDERKAHEKERTHDQQISVIETPDGNVSGGLWKPKSSHRVKTCLEPGAEGIRQMSDTQTTTIDLDDTRLCKNCGAGIVGHPYDDCDNPEPQETNPVNQKFEERLVELLGVSALMKDELSPYDIAKMFYRAGYRDGDHHGFTMGRRNGQ